MSLAQSTLPQGPMAWQLPGQTATEYAMRLNYRFPPNQFTIEGFIKVDPVRGPGRFMFSFNTQGNDNCILAKSTVVTYNTWVHWAVVLNPTTLALDHYLNGVSTTSTRDTATYCNRSVGALVLGHDQDAVGGRLDANQAPGIAWDSLRVHNTSLTQAAIQAIANGGDPGQGLWSSWCFSDPSNFGYDAGTSGQNFIIYGGAPTQGVSQTCGIGSNFVDPNGPLGFHLPGGTNAQMAIRPNMTFPDNAWTMEGFVKVAPGSGGRYLWGYNVNGNDNCILVRSAVGTYGAWVHWAMTVAADRTIQHYVNGVVNNGPRYSTTFCGNQGGFLVLGHDQDAPGGGLDANQAPNVVFDGLRIHNTVLSLNQIQALANGANPLAITSVPLWANWCMSNPADMGYDASTRAQRFNLLGGFVDRGVASVCAAAPPPAGPIAMHLPGGSITSYARIWNMTWPTGAFTVEGFIKVMRGSDNRFMFSYNQNGNDNCLLAYSTIGVYDTWVHWAMTVAAGTPGAITHYVNGTMSTLPRYSTTFCRAQSGALVLGQDQDHHLGAFDANQAPNMMFDSLRIHSTMLSTSQIAGIAAGTAQPPANPVNNWCFSNPDDFGYDAGSAPQNFTVNEARAAVGLTSCGPAATSVARPVAFQLPGNTNAQMARRLNYVFPPVPFTMEGFVKIDPLTTSGDYFVSFATSRSTNCLLESAVISTYGVWVHWATVVSDDLSVQSYVNGQNVTSAVVRYCNFSLGSLVLGHDQDAIGGGLDPRQAPNIAFDSLRVHNTSLNATQLSAISNGASPGNNLWSSWCFSDPNNFGFDSGLSGQNFDIYGGGIEVGNSHCGPAPTRISGPVALNLPGGTTSQYAMNSNMTLPLNSFTVEGFIKVQHGSQGRYFFSYAAPTGNFNCILVNSNVGIYGAWVHWAMTVDASRTITHYINGQVNTAIRSTATFCATSSADMGGALVLGQEQDGLGSRLDANQAPNIVYDGLRIHSQILTVNQIQALMTGRNATSLGTSIFANWCFSNPDDFGVDSSANAQHFTIYGGRPAPGLSNTCGGSYNAPAPAPPQSPLAFHLPGGTVLEYASRPAMQFPPVPFTVEGFVKVNSGSDNRFMFSYNTAGNDNCLLVRSTVGTYDVWVHWAMVVSTNLAITHYVNGTVANALLDPASINYCNNNVGALFLGHDQDAVNGALDPRQAPNIDFDVLRVHNASLSVPQISAIANGGHPGADLWTEWCFEDPTNMGYDRTPRGQNLTILGGTVVPGYSNICGGTPSPTSPAPTTATPTTSPTAVPTASPTAHPCLNNINTCDTLTQLCVAVPNGGAAYTCECRPGYIPTVPPSQSCIATSAPTTASPTNVPSTLPPTPAPTTMQPTPWPTTLQPTTMQPTAGTVSQGSGSDSDGVGGVATWVLILVVVLIVVAVVAVAVIVRKNSSGGGAAAAAASAPREKVQFENPMYDETGHGDDAGYMDLPVAGEEGYMDVHE